MLNKHKTTIRLISILMFIAGVLCLSFPFVSGDIISIIVGILLICAGLALMVGLFTHRQHNFWPVVGGFRKWQTIWALCITKFTSLYRKVWMPSAM